MSNISLNITSIDGRYKKESSLLSGYFSEFALMKYRTLVECEFLIFLVSYKGITKQKFSERDIGKIRNIYINFNQKSFNKIKKFENITKHDVKAIEYFLVDQLSKINLYKFKNFVHFGLTSEDTNNIAYTFMVNGLLDNIFIPDIKSIIKELNKLSSKYKSNIMLSRTHGIPASPTTFGKEVKVFTNRLNNILKEIQNHRLSIKINGAVGNYNAFEISYPSVNWLNFSKSFVNHLNKKFKSNFSVNLITTQIESGDSFVSLFNKIYHINSILIGFNQDIWRYISEGWIIQSTKKGEIGSSTMPHKINPINFENSEGNLGIANSLFDFFIKKIPISRLQRDLSDSTIKRSFGQAFAHSHIAYMSLLKGLSKISIDKDKMISDLCLHPEVITEAIQTILRRENYGKDPYKLLKDFSRGKRLDNKIIFQFIESLDISDKIKNEIKKINILNYIGLAKEITDL